MHGGWTCFDMFANRNLWVDSLVDFVVVLAYPNLWVDYLVWVNSLVDFYVLICLVWIDFCVVGVVFVMGWGMFKGISIIWV